MKTNLIRLFAVTLMLVTTNCMAQSPEPPSLLVLSKGDHTLAILNSVTLKVIARVPVGPDPHEVVASYDGKMAYVTNTGGGRSSEINVIDLVAQKALPNIDTRPLTGPHGIMFSGGKVWFSAEGAKSVGRYDPSIGKLDWSMGMGRDRTHMIYVTADEKKIYTTNVNEGSVSILTDSLLQFTNPMGVVQTRRDWFQTIVKVSYGVEGFDVSPDGKQLWAASSGDGTVAVIDLATKKVAYVIDAGAIGANRLKFTPDGKHVLISSLRSGDLLVYHIDRKELKKIKIGSGAAGILVEENGARAFIACTPDNYVAVLDLKKMEVTNHIVDAGPGPDGLGWAVRR